MWSPFARVTVLAKENHISASTAEVPDELRERAIREVRTAGRPVAKALGIHKEALRQWVRQAEADHGERDD